MRKRLFEIIEVGKDGDKASLTYDYIMMAVIIVSLVPLAFKDHGTALRAVDLCTVAVFIADYFLRIITADYKIKKGVASFFLYAVTPLAIIDLLCIVPSFTAVSSGFRLLKIIRLLRTFRVIRALKMFRYSRSILIIYDVIREQKAPLGAVCTLAVGYVLLSALIVFNVEPDTFGNFFDAIYWATVSLTTVGYGDIYPVSTAGRIVTMLSSIVGIAIVALPAGIITAGYMDRIQSGDRQA